ncbi:MAG TPA: hypothetical protein VE010_10970, partial [Thermoanaerobaculia bacterium]|nr:hypothetical protein [Thermoanaerobaculia bacterium]
MSFRPSPVPSGVKSFLLSALTLVFCATSFAADVDPKLDRAVRDALPVCAGATVSFGDLPVKLPPRFTGKMVRVESADHACDGQYAAIVSPAGNLLVGAPWPIGDEEGKGAMEKLKSFAWRNMQQNVTVEIDDKKRTIDGLFKTTILQQTEYGKMPLEGTMDEDGRFFFFGTFRPMNGDVRAARAKAFEAFSA